MSLHVRDFAKSTEPSIKRSRSFDRDELESEDEDISYLPPPTSTQSSSSRRQHEDLSPHFSEVPKFRDEKPFFGPVRDDGNISVKYPSMIDGYENDDNTMAQMESMGLPTGFSLQGKAIYANEKQKKGDKKTFYCQICLIELNSLDTMKSHINGVKHMKKELAINAQREEKVRRGELDPDKAKMGPRVVAIPNPEKTKVKVPTRLHEKIRESREPIVGLDFVKEWIAPSDPEMEPHYECQLCGSKGIANGMFSHILGYKHRQAFVEKLYEDDPTDVLNLTQSELLKYARKYAENDKDLKDLIKTVISDEEYPWPPGKAPWAVEKGGSGVAPDRARENWGKNKDFSEDKPVIINHVRSSSVRSGGLPSPSNLKPPKDSDEALKMISLAQKLFKYGVEFLGSRLSSEEENLLGMTTSTLQYKILSTRDIEVPSQSTNGHHSPTRNSSHPTSSQSSSSNKRAYNSRSPSPTPRVKRERNSSYHDEHRGHDERNQAWNGDSYRESSRSLNGGYHNDHRERSSWNGDYQRENSRSSNGGFQDGHRERSRSRYQDDYYREGSSSKTRRY